MKRLENDQGINFTMFPTHYTILGAVKDLPSASKAFLAAILQILQAKIGPSS